MTGDRTPAQPAIGPRDEVVEVDVAARLTGTGTAVGLCVMAGIIGVLAVVAARLIHRVNPLSGYSAIGAIPGFAAVTWLLAVA